MVFANFIVITKGEDFVVVPSWLHGDVYQYVRGYGNGNSLHTEEHGKVFGGQQKRKSLKKPRPPAKNPGMSYMIPEKKEAVEKYVYLLYTLVLSIFWWKSIFKLDNLRNLFSGYI